MLYLFQDLLNHHFIINQDDIKHPNLATSLEEAENIVITDLFRNVSISGYGLVIFEDSISIKNFI